VGVKLFCVDRWTDSRLTYSVFTILVDVPKKRDCGKIEKPREFSSVTPYQTERMPKEV
jgi:hypothetical protein